jgi:glutaredoxin
MPQVETEVADPSAIRVFGQSGCSSCLRLKEFVEKTGLHFVHINLQFHPDARDELKRNGLPGAPAAALNGRYVRGNNLAEVAELIGVEYDGTVVLSPQELKDRFDRVTAAFGRYLAQMQQDKATWAFCLPNRDRTMLDTASHGATVSRTMPKVYYTDVFDLGLYALPGDVSTIEEVAGLLAETRRQVDEWWEQDGIDDSYERVVLTNSGHRTLLEVWEREVWHTAHHTRQIMHALELQGIQPDGPLTAEDLQGLPLPQRINE